MFSWLINNPVARQIGAILLAILGTFAAYKIWKSNVENGVRRQERDAIAIKQAEEQARIDEARRDQAQENTDASQRADDTADSVPWVRARDELWNKSPGDAAILLDPVKPSGS